MYDQLQELIYKILHFFEFNNDKLAYFEPPDIQSGFFDWSIKVLGIIIGSYVIVWIFAMIFCRILPAKMGRIRVRVYWGWLVPLTVHTFISMSLLLSSAKYYKDLGLNISYCNVFFIPVFISGIFGIVVSKKIQERLSKQ